MLTYHDLDTPSEAQWLELLNAESVRRHLLQHPQFTSASLQTWLQSKIREDQRPGCRIRAVLSDGELAGWCGIQLETDGHELAIVLSHRFWGHGRQVMNQVVAWAQEMGHRQLLAYLPTTRPQTRAIGKMFGEPVGVRNIQGHEFNTYRIMVKPAPEPTPSNPRAGH